jgi:hypothetical protein
MSGPPYPHPNPAPGSNAIGEFQIGVSPIGTITSFDVWSTVLSQYANAPILTQLITDMAAYIDQTADFDAFYDFIWNVDTAQGRGLDIWGRIVNVSRTLQLPAGDYFGFAEAVGDGGINSFNSAPFYSDAPLTANYNLTDEPYRLLIIAKALYNITDCSIPAINQILLNLFPNRGNAYVADGYPFQGLFFGFAEQLDTQPFGQAPFFSGESLPNMSITYVFEFALSPVELAIVSQSGALPKPTGVRARMLQNA